MPLLKLVVGLCRVPLLDEDLERERFALNTWFTLGVVVVYTVSDKLTKLMALSAALQLAFGE